MCSSSSIGKLRVINNKLCIYVISFSLCIIPDNLWIKFHNLDQLLVCFLLFSQNFAKNSTAVGHLKEFIVEGLCGMDDCLKIHQLITANQLVTTLILILNILQFIKVERKDSNFNFNWLIDRLLYNYYQYTIKLHAFSNYRPLIAEQFSPFIAFIRCLERIILKWKT